MMHEMHEMEILINNLVTYRNVVASPPKVETWGDRGWGPSYSLGGPGSLGSSGSPVNQVL
jgi:hypothetical protein